MKKTSSRLLSEADKASKNPSKNTHEPAWCSCLPPSPANILFLGGDSSGAVQAFRRLGYEVVWGENAVSNLWRSEIFEQGFDAVLIHGVLSELVRNHGLSRFIRAVQKGLKPGGALIVIGNFSFGSGEARETADPLPMKDVITVLYENGFSIRTREKLDRAASEIFEPVRGRGRMGSKAFKRNFSDISNVTEHRKIPEGRDRKLFTPMQSGFYRLWAVKGSLFLRSYEPGDEENILHMFKEIFNADRTLAQWYWKFRDNPFGAYRIAQAFSHDGELAGHYSGYPVVFVSPAFEGKSFMSLQMGDIMTRANFRHLGRGNTSVLGRLTDYFHQKFCVDQVPFIYGFVAGKHRRFGERFLNYRYMGGIPYYVLNASALKGRPGRLKRRLSGITVQLLSRIDSEFDRFFEKASQDYGLLVRRDAAYIKWRYLDCPENEYRCYAVRKRGKLLGWGVFRIREDVLIWGDILFQKKYAPNAAFLLAHVLNKTGVGIRRVEAWFSENPAWWRQMLCGMGFTKIKEPNGLVAGVSLFDLDWSLDDIRAAFYYTMGDSDLF